MQESVSDCSHVEEFWKLPFFDVRLLSAPAAAYLATSVLPSSTTSGGVLPANAVSSLVPMSPHCWSSTLTVTFGYLALKSELTPSITDCGALPFMSHTVNVPVWLAGFVELLLVLPHAATTTAATTAVTPTHVFLKFICAPSPCWL